MVIEGFSMELCEERKQGHPLQLKRCHCNSINDEQFPMNNSNNNNNQADTIPVMVEKKPLKCKY